MAFPPKKSVTTNVAWVSMIHIKTYFIYWPSS